MSSPPIYEQGISAMRSWLHQHGVDTRQCIEKGELIDKCKQTLEKQPTQPHSLSPNQHRTEKGKCNCMQQGNTTQAAPASSYSSSSSASSLKPNATTTSPTSPSAKSPLSSTDFSTSTALIHSIPVGPLQCNMTILVDRSTRTALLVDPGGDASSILALLRSLGDDITVSHICVTHAHFDHFLAAGEVQRALGGTPIALHSADLPLWRALPLQCMMLGMPAPTQPMPEPNVDLAPLATTCSSPAASSSAAASLPVLDGRVLHTPGHSPGSCCFYFAGERLLLSGDTLFRGSVGRTDLMGGNSAQLVASIQDKLYSLPDDTRCIPGHGEFTSVGWEKKNNGVVREKEKERERGGGGSKQAASSL